MEKLVLFRERQEVTADDLSNTGNFARDSMDHIVHDGIQDGNGWAEFNVAETGVAEVTVDPGRLYFSGAVYVAEDDNVFDLIGNLPNTNYKWVAIVGYGNSVDTDTQPRDFLVDATTGATEPAAVSMQRLRKAEIATIVGVEAPQPAKPTIGSGNILIAWVYLDPTGVSSITMAEEYRLPQAARNAQDIDALEAWKDTVGPQIDALRSLIASLQAQLDGVASNSFDIDPLYIDMARVKEALELEDSYTDYDADRFLDTDESDTENVNYLAKVEEGVRFSDDASQMTNLDVFNPLNPDVVVSNNMLLPKFTEVRRVRVYPFHEELSISQYTYQSHAMRERTVSRTRIRYGEEKTVCTNNNWWRSGRYDPVQGVFHKDGDTWELISGNPNGHGKLRLRRFWVDTYEEHYWDRICVDHTINGQQIGQTFLNASDGWLTSIGLYFTKAGGTGNVSVALAQVKNGAPDVDNLIGITTLAVEDILTSADGTTETKVTFPATFLEGGKRYAIVLTTGGNHYVAMAQGTEYAQGTFFYSVDGAYQMGTFDKDMMFSLYFAKFNKIRTVVDLEAMSLSGGITDIDILAPMVLPESCSLSFEVQVSGVWQRLEEVQSGNTVLYGLPPLLPFRAVFTGTNDVQPGINMLESVLMYSRPRTTFKHISSEYTLASSTQDFKVVAIIENYYETNHDLACTILIDGTGSEVAAASVSDVELDPPVDARSVNHKRIKRTWTWTATEITSAMSSVKIVANGTTSSALDTFHLGERVHLAF